MTPANTDDAAIRALIDERLAAIRERVWAQRMDVAFDTHADALVDFFRKVMAGS